MKKITLSLVATLVAVTYAQAEVKLKDMGGSVSLFYGTNDSSDKDLFDNGANSYGDAALNLHGSAQLGKCDCTSLNFGVTGVSTMGLENTLVGATWVDHDATLSDALWIDTLNISFKPLDGISNTTMVVGRQALDTPMVMTETWNIAKNTFDAAVVVNNDIKETTLVGAWVGRSSGFDAVDRISGYPNAGSFPGGTVRARNISDGFNSFLTNEGAYAIGAVTKAIPYVDTQAWYYIAPSTAKVAFAQMEGNYAGFSLGGQYGMLDADDNSDGNVYAVKVGYEYEGIGLMVAYSSVDELSGTSAKIGFKNLDGVQSPLYTEAWWGFGHVGESDTDTLTASASYSLENVADLGLYYTNADHATGDDLTEITVTAGKDFGALSATLAYINTELGDADAQTDIQAYLTYNF